MWKELRQNLSGNTRQAVTGQAWAGRSRHKARELLDHEPGRDGDRSVAGGAVRDPANRLCHVAVPAKQPAALETIPGLAVVVLVLEADRARVCRVAGIISTSSDRWASCRCPDIASTSSDRWAS